jgi:hypothetical protein
MKNTFTLSLLTTILATTSIITTISPAAAGWREDNQQYQRQQESNRQNTEMRKYGEQQREQIWQNMQPTRTTSPSGSYSTPSGSSSSSDGSGLDGLGALFGFFNFGPSFISSNGEGQYGIQSKFGFENIRIRTGLHFGSGSSINGAFTYSLSNQATMFNPFVGAGLGMKSINKVGTITSDEFSFYGTGGVDMKIADSISITGAVNLPTNSAYGTEFQAGINFFGSF